MIIRSAMGHDGVPPEEYADALAIAARDFIYLAASKRYGRSASATNTDRLESIKVCLTADMPVMVIQFSCAVQQ